MANMLYSLLKRTIREWNRDMVPRLAAAVAFYTLFSLAPLLLLTITVAGSVYGHRAARGEIAGALSNLVGADMANATEAIIADAAYSERRVSTTLFGAIVLFFAASSVFRQLQSALNSIWHVPPRPGVIRGFIVGRLFSAAMVFLVVSFLVASLFVTTTISHLRHDEWMSNVVLSRVWQLVNVTTFFFLLTLLFALIFRYLPSVRTGWSTVWIGAAVAAALFEIGQGIVAVYLARSGVVSTYGAAGSLVAILIWVYYTASVLLFAAEFTKVLAQSRKDFDRRVKRR